MSNFIFLKNSLVADGQSNIVDYRAAYFAAKNVKLFFLKNSLIAGVTNVTLFFEDFPN